MKLFRSSYDNFKTCANDQRALYIFIDLSCRGEIETKSFFEMTDFFYYVDSISAARSTKSAFSSNFLFDVLVIQEYGGISNENILTSFS